ncbi:MAG: FAD:protein FMN transferase, partial [Pedobacter sp.]
MREFKISGQAQGTTYSANYFATDSLVTKSQIDSILNVIDLSMSLY